MKTAWTFDEPVYCPECGSPEPMKLFGDAGRWDTESYRCATDPRKADKAGCGCVLEMLVSYTMDPHTREQKPGTRTLLARW